MKKIKLGQELIASLTEAVEFEHGKKKLRTLRLKSPNLPNTGARSRSHAFVKRGALLGAKTLAHGLVLVPIQNQTVSLATPSDLELNRRFLPN